MIIIIYSLKISLFFWLSNEVMPQKNTISHLSPKRSRSVRRLLETFSLWRGSAMLMDHPVDVFPVLVCWSSVELNENINAERLETISREETQCKLLLPIYLLKWRLSYSWFHPVDGRIQTFLD